MSDVIASTYEIIEKIGAGGGGNVFLANHLRLGKKVVLKADKRKITTRPDLLRREVDILKDLSHSYIPQVYDFFIEGETVYTVMDFIEGESLDKPLKRGERFSQPQVIQWATQLLEALCYLHSPTHGSPPRGFVHSDIKPANMMRTPYNDICLIDFNIALALGEENVVGCSAGYASPEHYGLDFSSVSGTATADDSTETLDENTATVTLSGIEQDSSSTTKKKTILPDVRSDIYSVGATLYHLLSGKRPAKDAKEVIPLSTSEFSPQIVAIISKAMNPNPDLRFQTADEMLDAFLHLRENDPRAKRFKRNRVIASILICFLFLFGASTTFVGLKRVQITESWLKLAEYSQNALAKGDTAAAIDYALQALPQKTNLFTPGYIAEAQKALTDALGVYDLSDGFKTHETVELPSAPLYMGISPDGKTAACVYAYSVAVFDTDTSEIIATLPATRSALAEVKYLDNNIIIYAGDTGITAYSIESRSELWHGNPATGIAISGDRTSVVGVYKNDEFATVYDTGTGQIRNTVDFEGKHQHVTVNDSFANPNNNLLALNDNGTLLGVSFDDGSLQIFNLEDSSDDIIIYDETSGYTHFEGGFYQQYFAFSSSNSNESVFAVIDTVEKVQTGGFESDKAFSVETDKDGVYVQTENLLVKIHPVTGEQTPLITTAENVLRFSRSNTHTIVTYKGGYMFFDKNAVLTSSHENEFSSDFVQIAEGTVLIGSMDSPVIRIMKYENHPDTEFFTYDTSYPHDEARMSDDGSTVMLFSYKQFRIYSINGDIIKEVSIPDAEQVYDQQYIRDDNGSRLEVIYNNGRVLIYNARDGNLITEEMRNKPDPTLYEEFFTDTLRIESPLHGTPAAYDIKSGKLVRELSEDAYLTYVTQSGEYIVTQYVTGEGFCYGLLLNSKCETIAYLPYLSDIYGEVLLFDYPTGNLRQSRIFNINELISLAETEVFGGK